MKFSARFSILLFLIIILFFNPTQTQAAQGEPPVPPGFEQLLSDVGVAFYEKIYANGSPDYVQTADLGLGAQVRVLHGEIAAAGAGQGVFGGDNPRFGRLSIKQFWNKLASLTEGAFCVANGQFFRLAESPTPLPFPLKVDGQILTDGYGIKEFPDQKLILEIWPDRLDIRALTKENLYSSSAPDIVGGLTEDAEKASKKAVGRTFIGISDRDEDGKYETLMIFNTQVAKPPAAADVLRAFGADKVMMLDGGGSTQLICQDKVYINTDRLIPQAIGIAAGQLAPLAASLSTPAEIPIVFEGEQQSIPLSIRNSGSTTWQPADTQLLVESAEDSLRATLSISQTMATGAHSEFDWQVSPGEAYGLHRANISLAYKGELFPLQAGKMDVIILPLALQEMAPDLRARLAEWAVQPGADLAAQVETWMEEQRTQPVAQTQQAVVSATQTVARQNVKPEIGDIIWIPLLMIPMIALLIAVVQRVQQTLN